MTNQGRVKVGIIGSQFQADIHATSLQIMPDDAEVVAVASPSPGNAAAFARKFGIPRVFTDYREMLPLVLSWINPPSARACIYD